MCIIYHSKQVYIQKYRPEVGVQGCDIARGLYHIQGHPSKVYIFCILTGFSMLYRIYFIIMTAFLNGRYIYKNINPTTSKDDVIIMRYIYILYPCYIDPLGAKTILNESFYGSHPQLKLLTARSSPHQRQIKPQGAEMKNSKNIMLQQELPCLYDVVWPPYFP